MKRLVLPSILNLTQTTAIQSRTPFVLLLINTIEEIPLTEGREHRQYSSSLQKNVD